MKERLSNLLACAIVVTKTMASGLFLNPVFKSDSRIICIDDGSSGAPSSQLG